MDYEDLADVIVIGGGVAGMIAARNLARIGARVILLEARDRLGGRIFSQPSGKFSVELGAGFVHGDNETLWELVQESGAHTCESPAAQWIASGGQLTKQVDLWDRLANVMKQIDAENYGSFGAWVKNAPASISAEDRKRAIEFVENFHAGQMDAVSAGTLRDTRGGAEDSQHVVDNGYDRVVKLLEQECYAVGVEILLNTSAVKIVWEPGAAMVISREESEQEDRPLGAKAVLLTVPLGVLKAPVGERGAIEFSPDLSEKRRLWQQIPFGFASRLTLRFRETFWEESLLPSALSGSRGENFGFIHAPNSAIPVWWSAAPAPVLVGWAGGPSAKALSGKSKDEVVRLAIDELGKTLAVSSEELRQAVQETYWHDWASDPYSRGGYSFSVAGQEDAPKRLAEAVENTIFFAGEATAGVDELGTVGGALSSGERAASEIRRLVAVEPGSVPGATVRR